MQCTRDTYLVKVRDVHAEIAENERASEHEAGQETEGRDEGTL